MLWETLHVALGVISYREIHPDLAQHSHVHAINARSATRAALGGRPIDARSSRSPSLRDSLVPWDQPEAYHQSLGARPFRVGEASREIDHPISRNPTMEVPHSHTCHETW